MDPASLRTILLFGGSFDPPHRAHLDQARLAMQALGADAVAFIPAGRAPHKDTTQTDARDRLEMVRLAVADEPRFFVLDDEVTRAADGRPSFTVDTLETLRQRWGPGVKLRLLMGADMLRIFPKWRAPGRIVELAEPLVLVRPPETREGLLSSLPPGLPGGSDPAIWGPRILAIPPVEMSSTDIRDRLSRGEDVAGFVPPPVLRYIASRGIYRR